jgi:RHH-type proline utilization regulon transcriptional repressor/proline dehydrogenase/delta 1-pyrroline-5-carboxylate dehydrogenase
MYEKVRWLSREKVPYSGLLTFDSRKLCQRGDIEIRRWLVEQTISITSHRYGNINAGPKPLVKSDFE